MVMVHSVAITLLRHGLTEANERKEYLGWTGFSVKRAGADGNQQLKAGFQAYELIISSDLQRCVDTAKLLFPEVPIQQILPFAK